MAPWINGESEPLLCHSMRLLKLGSFIESMDKAGVVLDQVACTIIMVAHINSGEINHATDLFNQMKRDGCMAYTVTFDTLIKGYSIAQRGMEALSLFHMMQKRGFLPSKSSCHRLLYCLCQSHASDLAFRLFEEMLSLGNIPQHDKYYKLLFMLLEEESLQAAHKTLDMMLKRGKTPVHEAKKQLLNIC